jgi:sulfur carrier protein
MDTQQTFYINGQQFFANKNLTIKDILEYFNYRNNLFIIEYNNLICDRNEWSKIKINYNDKIEIITIVGGG